MEWNIYKDWLDPVLYRQMVSMIYQLSSNADKEAFLKQERENSLFYGICEHSMEEEYNLHYPGEVLERMKERRTMTKPVYRALGLALAGTSCIQETCMFNGTQKSGKGDHGDLGISCHWRSRTCRLFHGAKLQACGCYRDPNRDFLWRGGWIFSWQSYHADLQHVYGAGSLDTLADVCLWYDRISGRDPVPEGDFKSQEVRSLYLWIFKCLFNLWRHYESCQHPDVLRVHYKKQPDRLLHFRCACGSGTCSLHRDLPVAA